MIFRQRRGSEDTLFWKTQANNAETQAKSLKTQAYRQLWLFMVVENGRKNKPELDSIAAYLDIVLRTSYLLIPILSSLKKDDGPSHTVVSLPKIFWSL